MAKRRRRRELIEADRYRALAVFLLRVRHSDWWEREWEETFLRDQVHRPDDYIYSESQQAKLKQLKSFSRSFSEYAGYTVRELLTIAYVRRCDLEYEDQEWVEKLYDWGTADLKLRQITRLASICRLYEPIGRDALTDSAIDEFRADERAA
jgi:hypothetical protein